MSSNDRRKPEELDDLFLLKPVQVIAVAAGKGGVGKSNVAINLSIALAQLHKNVLLLDADLGLANVDIMLGLQSKYNLSHVIQGTCSLNEIILTGPEGIRVIPAASGVEFMTQLSQEEHAGIINSFNELTYDLDYMIIDTAAGISETVLSFIRSSQELIVIACDEPTSLVDAYALMKIMNHRYEWSNFHILVNMVNSSKEARSLFNRLLKVTSRFLDIQLNYLGFIPFDEHVRKAIKKQQPVYTAYPNSKAALAIKDLANQVVQWPFKHALVGNTSFFLERLILGRF